MSIGGGKGDKVMETIIYCIIGFLIGSTYGIYLYIKGARKWGWGWFTEEIKDMWRDWRKKRESANRKN